MKRGVTLTMEEVRRYNVIRSLLEGKSANREAALALGLSVRQVKRVKRKVVLKGVWGIFHGNKWRLPAHTFPIGERDRIIGLAEGKYYDFNFSHLSEILREEEGISISHETLRLWLRPRGFGSKVHKMPRHRKRRPRSVREGQQLFLDGSPHRWYGTEETTLLLCTDDATGNPLYGCFQKEEDLDGCFRVLMEVFKKYGLPVKFYLDKASHFTTTRHGGIHVAQSDNKPTQFERAMSELGVGIIFADSPQARGRGERINGTFQDRLVAELRLRNINNALDATKYLNQNFIPRYCRRFGVEPQEKTPAWRPVPKEIDLRNILCKRFLRTVNNDNTISVKGQIIQLLKTKNRSHFAKAKVYVNQWLDGSWHVFHPTEGEIPCEPIISNLIPDERKIIMSQGG